MPVLEIRLVHMDGRASHLSQQSKQQFRFRVESDVDQSLSTDIQQLESETTWQLFRQRELLECLAWPRHYVEWRAVSLEDVLCVRTGVLTTCPRTSVGVVSRKPRRLERHQAATIISNWKQTGWCCLVALMKYKN